MKTYFLIFICYVFVYKNIANLLSIFQDLKKKKIPRIHVIAKFLSCNVIVLIAGGRTWSQVYLLQYYTKKQKHINKNLIVHPDR